MGVISSNHLEILTNSKNKLVMSVIKIFNPIYLWVICGLSSIKDNPTMLHKDNVECIA